MWVSPRGHNTGCSVSPQGDKFNSSLLQFLSGGGMKIELDAPVRMSIELHPRSYLLKWGDDSKIQTVNNVLLI